MMKKIALLFFIFIALASCTDPQNSDCNFGSSEQDLDPCDNIEFKSEDFQITILENDEMPYIEGYGTMNERPIRDADSIPLIEFEGEKYYQPVYLAQYMLEMLDIFTTTRDSSYISDMEQIGDKLIEISEQVDSSALFPYPYDFYVHHCTSEKMTGTWYSAMAQGQALSVMCRLYELTQKDKYLKFGHKIFNSLSKIKGKNEGVWTACIDANSNLWYEEFPHDIPCHTFNGMIFTLFGLYDYYVSTGNLEAKNLLQAGILTIKTNIDYFRNPGGCSIYCKKHTYIAENYHPIHIGQLKMLYKISNDEAFKQAVSDFESDFE